jgi:amino acid transporter
MTRLVRGRTVGRGVARRRDDHRHRRVPQTAVMAQLGGSARWVRVAWAVAGALSFFGAMTYAELGGMFPSAGGEYVYLRRGYGPAMGYLYAWNRFWIATPGSIAAYAVGTATFIGVFAPVSGYVVDLGVIELDATKAVGIGFIALFTAINCLNVRAGGNLQTAMTVFKVLMIAGIAFGAFLAPSGRLDHVIRLRSPVGRSARWCSRRCGRTTAGTTCRWPPVRCAIRSATCRARSSAA